MADPTQIDPHLAIAKARAGISQQENALQNNYVRIMEAVASIKQARINIDASHTAIQNYKETLQKLEEEHGEFTSEHVLQLAKKFAE